MLMDKKSDKVVSPGTIKQLLGSVPTIDQYALQLQIISIILLYEVRDMLYVMYFAAVSVSLWLSPTTFSMLAGANINGKCHCCKTGEHDV